MMTVFGKTFDEILDLIHEDEKRKDKAMPKDTREQIAAFSGEAFMEAMNLLHWMDVRIEISDHQRQEIQRRLFEVMRLTAESGSTYEVERVSEPIDPVKLAGDFGVGHIVRGMEKFITEDAMMGAMEYDTVLGWLAKHAPHTLMSLDDPIEDTKRDGFWLTHRCNAHGIEVIKVRSPDVMPAKLPLVNAYPKELIAERFERKGVI